ncbi:MAG: hypothetical protein AAGA95_22385, partial [Pseudomonadota bacterium]
MSRRRVIILDVKIPVVTAAGRAISSMAMLVGYAIIVVPTGIFTSNMMTRRRLTKSGAPMNCP